MTVLWLDPYIDAPIGGIHGTTDTTSRTGTYSAPLAMSDFIKSGTGEGSVSSYGNADLNGVTEIRMKGLPESSFKYNGDTTTTSLSASTISVSNSTFNDAYISEYSGTSVSHPLLMLYHPDIYGDLDFFLFSTDGLNSDDFSMYSTGSYYTFPYLSAARNLQHTVAVVDPDYILTVISDLGFIETDIGIFRDRSSYSNNITITDGWTSSTVRNGINILAFNYGNDNAGEERFYGCDDHLIFDCPDTHIIDYAGNGSQIDRPYRFYLRYAQSQDQKIGAYYSGTRDSWSYVYGNGTDNMVFKALTGRYVRPYNTGTNNIEIDNIIGERWYNFSANGTITHGHLFAAAEYTNNTWWSYDRGPIVVKDNAFLYIMYGPLFAVTTDVTFGNNVTNYENTTVYINAVTADGPSIAAILDPHEDIYGNPKVNATPSDWTETQLLTLSQDNRFIYEDNYAQSIYAVFPELEMNGQDYRNVDIGCRIKVLSYVRPNHYPTTQITFESNTFDGVSIMCLAPCTSSINATHAPMIAYNDINNSNKLTIQSNGDVSTDGDNKLVLHRELPDLSGASNITLDLELERTPGHSGNNPRLYLYYPNGADGSSVTYQDA